MRVVSLLPSATEMVCAVGRRDSLVGVSHECDWPGDVVGLPVLTRARVSPLGSSAAIDRDVRELSRDALSVYSIDVEGLRLAAPDVIVTQDLCDVCAVSYEDVCAAARELGNPELTIVNLHPTRLADVWEDLRRVGRALDAVSSSEQALTELLARVEAVRRRAEAVRSRPRVLTIEWLDPIMIGGMWMPELVELAGGVPLVTRAGQHAPTLTPEALAALDPAPDAVLIKPCGFAVTQTMREAEGLRALLLEMPWPAVEAGRVWVADGNAYFNRPGPRIVDSLELLAGCLHPEAFPELAGRYQGVLRTDIVAG